MLLYLFIVATFFTVFTMYERENNYGDWPHWIDLSFNLGYSLLWPLLIPYAIIVLISENYFS